MDENLRFASVQTLVGFLMAANVSDLRCIELLDAYAASRVAHRCMEAKLLAAVAEIKARTILGRTDGLSRLIEETLASVSASTPPYVLHSLIRDASLHEHRLMTNSVDHVLFALGSAVRFSGFQNFYHDIRALGTVHATHHLAFEETLCELEVCAQFYRVNERWYQLAKMREAQYRSVAPQSQHYNFVQATTYLLRMLRAALRGENHRLYVTGLCKLAEVYFHEQRNADAVRVLVRAARYRRRHRITKFASCSVYFQWLSAIHATSRGRRAASEYRHVQAIRGFEQCEDIFARVALLKRYIEVAKHWHDPTLQLELMDRLLVEQSAQKSAHGDPSKRVKMLEEVALLAEQELTALNPRVEEVGHRLDYLTRLPNREQLGIHLEQLTLNDERRVLAFIDMNNFKEVNDSQSHLAGDAAIQMFSARLNRSLARDGMLYRYGGDEFFWISDPTEEPERLIEALANNPTLIGSNWEHQGVTHTLSASAGIVQYPRDATTVESLLRYATHTMQIAKREKRVIMEFDEQIQQGIELQASLRRELRHVVFEQSFYAHFQPIVYLGDSRVVGEEALARWRRSDGTMVPPKDFIPILIELGREEELLRFMFKLVTQRLAKQSDPKFYISFNLSPSLLGKPGFAERFLFDLAGAGSGLGERIVLELIESECIDGNAMALQNAELLRASGIRLALDDFGTGFNSLMQLSYLPFDIIKIDRHFANGVVDGSAHQPMVKAVLYLASQLKKRVILEGIETHEQLVSARRLLRYGQGFYFGNEEALPEV